MYNNRIEFYKRLEEARGSKVLAFVTGDKFGMETQISADSHEYFVNHLDLFNLPEKITLFLYTRGGDTMAAWGLINLFKQFCNEYEVIVASKARSAGTLICLGANNIVMTKQASLGPIDPSLNGPLNPQNPQMPQNPMARIPVSVESIKGYFEYAKRELEIQGEEQLAKIFVDLSQKIHPLVIGDVFRSRSQIQMIAKKLLANHPGGEEKIHEIISFLCSESGSHDYPIYRREARQLGLNVETPSAELYSLIKETMDDISVELDLMNPFNPSALFGNADVYDYNYKRALIESVGGGTTFFSSVGQLKRNRVQIPTPGGVVTQWSIEDGRLTEGWKHENLQV